MNVKSCSIRHVGQSQKTDGWIASETPSSHTFLISESGGCVWPFQQLHKTDNSAVTRRLASCVRYTTIFVTFYVYECKTMNPLILGETVWKCAPLSPYLNDYCSLSLYKPPLSVTIWNIQYLFYCPLKWSDDTTHRLVQAFLCRNWYHIS